MGWSSRTPQETPLLTIPRFSDAQRPKVQALGLRVDNESAWSAFVLDTAGGLSPSALAQKYGFTLRKVELLLRNPELQEQVAACAKRLSKVGDYARHRLLAAAPELVDAQLEVALARDPVLDADDRPINGPNGQPLTKPRYDVRERMAAGRYCLDKILPTVIRSEEAPTQTTTEAVLQIRDSLAFLAGINQGQRSILDSPHVYEGKAALPRAIDLVDVEVATK